MADVFVATDGSDGNGGASIGDAYATLEKADNDAGLGAGDTVWLVVKKTALGNNDTFSSEAGTVTINQSGSIAGGSVKWRATNESGVVDGTMAVIDFTSVSLTAGGIHIQASHLFFQNISVENTADGVTGEGWLDDNNGSGEGANGTRLFFYGCAARNCGDDGFDCNSKYIIFYQCYAGDCSGSGDSGFRLLTHEDKHCFGCISENNGQDGFNLSADTSCWHCIANNNGAYGFRDPKRLINCTSVSNGAGGIFKTSEDDFIIVMNNISVGNTGFAFEIDPTSTRCPKWIANNAFSSTLNSSGTYDSTIDPVFEIEIGTIDLTEDPFVNAGLRDFTLNNKSGGGQLCRNAGKGFGRHTNSSNFVDIGAVQTAPRVITGG